MSTAPGFRKATSSSSSKAIGASDTEGQDCARVRPPAETPKKPTRTYSRPSTPAKRPSTPTKPLDPPSAIPIPRAGTRKYTHSRQLSNSSLAGASSPSKFILQPRASSPAVTNTVTASGRIASSPDSILDDSVLHAEPEIMSSITTAVIAGTGAKSTKEKPILSRKSAPTVPETSTENPVAPLFSQPKAPQGDRGQDPIPEPEEQARESPLPVSGQNPAPQVAENLAGGPAQPPEPTDNANTTAQKDKAPTVQPNPNEAKNRATPVRNSSSQAPVKSPPAPPEPAEKDAESVKVMGTQPAKPPLPATTTPIDQDSARNLDQQPSSSPQHGSSKSTGGGRPGGTAAPTNPTPSTPATTPTPATTTPGLPAVPPTPSLPLPSPINLLPLPAATELNQPGTDVGRINAVWNKWFNASAGSDVYVEPAAHRYDINDELVPDIVVYTLPSAPGQSPKWKIVYEGQPGVDGPPGLPSDQNWENARKRMEDVCARHKDQSPQWAVLAIGSWARIYKFIQGKLVGTLCTGGVLTPNPVPYKPDPDPNTNICVSLSMGNNPPFPYDVALQVALKQIFGMSV